MITYVGLSNSMARLLSACNAVSYFVFAGVAVLFVERLGRRSLMMISTFLQLIAFLCISVLLKYAIANGSTECAKAAIFFFFFYNIAFAVGMLGVPWLYPAGKS